MTDSIVFVVVQGRESPVLGRQIPFSDLMDSADLEVYRLSFQRVDLPLCHPETLVLCQSYAIVDPSFVPKLLRIDTASRFLILMGVDRVMGMFLAFSPGEIPPVVHRYMSSLEKLTRLVANVLGFELPLLQKIVANNKSRSSSPLPSMGQEQLCNCLKRRRAFGAGPDRGTRSLSIHSSPNATKDGPSYSV